MTKREGGLSSSLGHCKNLILYTTLTIRTIKPKYQTTWILVKETKNIIITKLMINIMIIKFSYTHTLYRYTAALRPKKLFLRVF